MATKKPAPAPYVEKPVDNVENPPEQSEQIEPIEPEANQTEPAVDPEKLFADLLASPEFVARMDSITSKLDQIETIIRGIINRDQPPADVESQHPQHIRRYL